MANKNVNIPTEVTRYQNEYGFNTSELDASNAQGDFYALSQVDSDGFVVPTGLPVFVIMKNGRAQIVTDLQALKLSQTLFADK